MGAFNVLHADLACPICRRVGPFSIQFRYGATWQLEYRVGDSLTWGRNDIGVRDAQRVLVQGLGGPCTRCGAEFLDFDILVTSNKIERVIPVGKDRVDEIEEGFVVLWEPGARLSEMKLIDVVVNLLDLDQEATIYARKPWAEDSQAIVEREPEDGGLPARARDRSMTYFIEVSIAREVLEGWAGNLGARPSSGHKCRRLIEYAIYDA